MKKRRLYISGLIILLAGLLLFDVFFFEPDFPRLYRLEVRDPDIPEAFDGFKIAFITDTHTTRFGRREERMFALVQRFSPGLIILGGDYIGGAPGLMPYDDLVAEAVKALSPLSAPCGVYAVRGNWDTDREMERYEELGIEYLNNESVALEKAGEKIYLVGMSMAKRADLGRPFAEISPDEFIILVSHIPDYLDKGLPFGVDLGLAGHSHGGQLRIPFIEVHEFWGCEKYKIGGYQVDDALFYVSRGVGAHFNLRFRCPSEVTAITLKREE